MDQNALQQISDRLKEANNVLVTVSSNPSVDQLAACIGFTLLLNHLGKHGTAVFSGDVPSTLEFLKPDDTLEKNTDSLRDFIIALDKSKADKLRYKVEDKVVKIFITPYRTSISDKDLEFSQGDFNVDVVLALGVHERADLDKAIMDHGRILHDATVISVNNKDQGNLGSINWVDLNASSLSEMMAELTHSLTKDALDGQMATAFMTGIVAETDRFSNTKTSPRTMSLAAELMSAGANQQLIASKLDEAQDIPADTDQKEGDKPEASDEPAASDDGSLQIPHSDTPADTEAPSEKPEPLPELPPIEDKKDEVDDVFGGLSSPTETPSFPSISPTKPVDEKPEPPAGMPSRASMALEPPSLGGQLTANSVPENLQADQSTDPMTLPPVDRSNDDTPPILNRPASLGGNPVQPADNPPAETDSTTPQAEDVEDARDAVNQAIASEPQSHALDPIQALGAQPLDLNLQQDSPAVPADPPLTTPPESVPPAEPAAQPTPPPAPEPPAFSMPTPPDPTLAPPETPAAAPVPPTPPTTPPAPEPFGAPPSMNGVNPNVPNNILPPSQPIDSTAGSTNPSAPPPVPPPLMPPSDAI